MTDFKCIIIFTSVDSMDICLNLLKFEMFILEIKSGSYMMRIFTAEQNIHLYDGSYMHYHIYKCRYLTLLIF